MRIHRGAKGAYVVMLSFLLGEFLCATRSAGLSELQHRASLLRQSDSHQNLPTLEAPGLFNGLQQAILHTTPESLVKTLHLDCCSDTSDALFEKLISTFWAMFSLADPLD